MPQNKGAETARATWKLFSNKHQFLAKVILVHVAQILVGYLNPHLEKL